MKDVLIDYLDRQGRKWSREGITQGRLEAFPSGYILYTSTRIDNPLHFNHHLFCADTRMEFRSPQEFAPHLAWLMKGQVGRCGCLPCNPKGPSQGEISARYKDINDYFSKPPPPSKNDSTEEQQRLSSAGHEGGRGRRGSITSTTGVTTSRPSSRASTTRAAGPSGFQAQGYRVFPSEPPEPQK